jgi:outer membrane protein, heavy metal efflux system
MRRIQALSASGMVGICIGLAESAHATVPGEQTLSLKQAIEASLSTPHMLAAREAVEQARADAQTAGLAPNPNLGIEVGLLPLSRRYTVDEPGGPSEFSAGLTLPVDGFVFGKRRAAQSSAEIAVRVAEWEYADKVRQRVAEIRLAFHAVLEAKALWELAHQSAQDLEQFESAMRRATANGGRPQVEWHRVQLELQGARREERAARLRLISAKCELRALLGWDESFPTTWEVEGSLDAPVAAQTMPVEEALRMAEQSRPDIQALRGKVDKAQRDEVLEGRNAWPETSLGVGLTHQFQHAIGAPDVTAWGATLAVGLPIFNRNQGNRRKATSVTLQAKHELAAAHAKLRAEVEQATRVLALAQENVAEIAKTDLELAAQVRDGMRKSHELGGRSLLEVLDAQRGYRETYKAFITSRAAYAQAISNYEATVGRQGIP